ncbi:MAG: hypothetical protein WD014_08065 [Dongiaceae bacterium]
MPDNIDVRAIRKEIGMTREVFAGHLGVSKCTEQDWGRGRHAPTDAARAFLTVIRHEPEAVRRALVW